MAAVIETLSDLVVVAADDGRIAYASQAADRLLQRRASYLVGQPLAGLVHPDDRDLIRELISSLGPARPHTAEPVELRLSHINGGWIDVEMSATDLRGDPDVGGLVLELRDITPRRTFEEALRHQAKHDPLTGLGNRTLFQEVLKRALARAQESPSRPHALLFMDLDGFKRINDSLGHAVGDEVLVMIAERLRTRVRPGDTAARLGGDEFAVLLENSSQEDAEAVAERILETVRHPYRVRGQEMVLSASLGIALTGDMRSPEELLRASDIAMYAAKAAGKDRCEVFRPEMQVAARRRLDMEGDLRRAIEHREFVLHYQPIVALADGALVGAEVLVRWNHPARGLLMPGEFIETSEECGLIVPMGRWILGQACQQTARWEAAFPGLSGRFQLHVNVSVRQLEDVGFLTDVVAGLSDSGLKPGALTLEITENLILRDFDMAVSRLQAIRATGVKIAIDDFGTGYSSLSYLKRLPVDELKIDRSFVEDVAGGPEQGAVALAVVKLARTFGMSTLAEGIENETQAVTLLRMGADLGQGYHFARPMDTASMERYLAGRRPA